MQISYVADAKAGALGVFRAILWGVDMDWFPVAIWALGRRFQCVRFKRGGAAVDIDLGKMGLGLLLTKQVLDDFGIKLVGGDRSVEQRRVEARTPVGDAAADIYRAAVQRWVRLRRLRRAEDEGSDGSGRGDRDVGGGKGMGGDGGVLQ